MTIVATGLGAPMARKQPKPVLAYEKQQRTGTHDAPMVNYNELDMPAVIRTGRHREAVEGDEAIRVSIRSIFRRSCASRPTNYRGEAMRRSDGPAVRLRVKLRTWFCQVMRNGKATHTEDNGAGDGSRSAYRREGLSDLASGRHRQRHRVSSRRSVPRQFRSAPKRMRCTTPAFPLVWKRTACAWQRSNT